MLVLRSCWFLILYSASYVLTHCCFYFSYLIFLIFYFFSPLILSFLHLLTYLYIVCATRHSFPYLQAELFLPLFLWFCWRENIRDNKKNISFLLFWCKESFTERFLVLLSCTCNPHWFISTRPLHFFLVPFP
jgi:hypothetical protein